VAQFCTLFGSEYLLTFFEQMTAIFGDKIKYGYKGN